MRKKFKTIGIHSFARSLDFIPVIGPICMLAGYLLGYDIVTRHPFKRFSLRGIAFFLCAICTGIAQALVAEELFSFFGWKSFDIPHAENGMLIILALCGSYLSYMIFLGKDIYDIREHRKKKFDSHRKEEKH